MSIIEQKVPNLGESITEITIGSWDKQTGDEVEVDEIIGVMESDKASFDITAEEGGVLELVAEEGDTIEVGAVMFKIDTSGNGNGAQQSEKTADKKEEKTAKKEEPKATETTTEAKSTGETIEMRVQPLGESLTEVVLGTWLKSDGDTVELDEIIAEIESDKATFELPAEAQGVLHIVAEEGDTMEVNDLICKIEVTEGGSSSDTSNQKETSKEQETSSTKTSQNGETEESYASQHPSPAALKILEEKGIDPKEVKGTGVGGRITKEDAMKAEKTTQKQTKTKQQETSQQEEVSSESTGNRNQRKERMSSLRKTIARRLVAVKNDTAMLTTFNEVNMKPIMDMRKAYKEQFKEKHEVGLGFMSFFAKACSQALLDFPIVNAQIEEDHILYNDFVDISIAVSTERGLVVPVIRNVEERSFAGIEKEIIRLATRARDGKLTIPEMTGGTFTITNGGIFGSMMSTPIINAPQSAILGMHNIVQRPMAVDGETKILPMIYLALSYDHRLIDGKDSVSFLVRVKQLLEAPERLLLGV